MEVLCFHAGYVATRVKYFAMIVSRWQRVTFCICHFINNRNIVDHGGYAEISRLEGEI